MTFTVRPIRTRTYQQRSRSRKSRRTDPQQQPPSQQNLRDEKTETLTESEPTNSRSARTTSHVTQTTTSSFSGFTARLGDGRSSSTTSLPAQQRSSALNDNNSDEEQDEDSFSEHSEDMEEYFMDHNVTKPKLSERDTLALQALLKTHQPQQDKKISLEFHVATWNVLWEPIHVMFRMKEIARLVKEIPRMWFVGFQEVTEESGKMLKQDFEAAGYHTVFQPHCLPYTNIDLSKMEVVSEDVAIAVDGGASCFSGMGFGCMLAVRQLSTDPKLIRCGFHAFEATLQGRGFCYVICQLPNRQEQILVATTHMDSIGRGDESSGTEQRAGQLLEFAAFTEQAMTENSNLCWAILTGDMNWNDTGRDATDEPMEKVLSGRCVLPWKDTWLETKPNDSNATCYTYDGLRNPMRNNSWRSRLDRTLVFSRDTLANQQLVCLGTNADNLLGIHTLMGNDNNAFLTFLKRGGNESPVAPSDHFGFASRLGFQFA